MVIGMTRTALHAAAPANRAAGLTLALQALSPPERDGAAEVVRTVVPAPGADGRLETQDGRAHRVSDPAALAAAIDAQDVGVRIDFDHQSEPMSPTFQGSTAAVGWARRFRAAADGSIEAVLDLSSRMRHEISGGCTGTCRRRCGSIGYIEWAADRGGFAAWNGGSADRGGTQIRNPSVAATDR